MKQTAKTSPKTPDSKGALDSPPYEPREDSYLLLDAVKRYARGRVLDMGTGSGILADAASKTADSVVAADINPAAIELAEKRCGANGTAGKIEFVVSDLFSSVRGRFDLIIFNPPYLPDDEDISDVALDGGKEGYELIEKFLSRAGEHLSKKGNILLLFSSLSNKEKVEQFISKNGFTFTEVARKRLFFEELYVYILSEG